MSKPTKRQYIEISRKRFEYWLWQMKQELKFPSYMDVTDDLKRNGYIINERVYMIKTWKPNVNILIYSTIDTRTDRSRSIGSDAVRSVLVVKNNQNKRYFKSLGKNLRITTIYDNLKRNVNQGLLDSKSGDFTKGFKEFNPNYQY